MNKNIWSVLKEFLVILVIPAIGWIIKIEVNRATDILDRENNLKTITRLETQLAGLKDLEKEIHKYALQEVRLEGKIDSTMERLHEIRTILNK